MIPYNIFYRQYGFRRLEQIVSPKLFSLEELPRDSFIHYFTNDEKHPDIDTNLPYLTKISNRRIYIDIPEFLLGDNKEEPEKQLFPGTPMRKNLIGRNLIKDFIKVNKQFKYLKDHYKVINDKLTVFINNYNYLNVIYKYRDMPLKDYYKWYNTQKTIYRSIENISSISEKNNFIFINIPKDIIPSYSFLRMYSNKSNITMLKVFDTLDKLLILDLWRWLDPETRHLSTLNNIPKNQLSKVSFIFTTPDNRSCLLNLAYLHSWIEGNDNITSEKVLSQYKFDKIQLLILKLLTLLQSNNPEELIVDNVEKISNDVNKDDIKEEVNDLEDDSDNIDESQKDYTDRINLFKEQPNDDKQVDKFLNIKQELKTVNELEEENSLDDIKNLNIDSLFKDIDEEMKVLDNLNRKKLLNKNLIIDEDGEEKETPKLLKTEVTDQEAKSSIYDFEEPNQVLNNILQESADINIISAAEYKKLDNLIKQYDTMKDPYGSDKTVKELSVITEQELILDDKKSEIISSDIIPDKSMLKSSLNSFTSDYVNKIMKKDIVSMVGGLQKAGVIVTKHQVQVENSALGVYENHVIELKPMDGMASTVRFRIPKINEDGSYIANGNKYLSRLQKIDIPLKKIDPTTVAMSSYYGKTFINLSTRKSNNSIEWISKQINKQSIEGNDVITKVGPANVFNSDFQAPYLYNALAEKYKIIQTKDLTLIFDYTEREKIVDKELLDKIETKGNRVIGYTNKKEPIVIDINNNFFTYTNNNFISIGNIYNILDIDESLSPVDFTNVKVFGKDIPVVTVLGYLVGIRKLLKVLGVQYKVMEGKNFKNLLKDEYRISFKDETYIFSRRDKVSSLVIAGLLEYEKELKKYTFDDLDNKDVYFNLLQSKGLGSIYIKEIDMFDKLFVDPITRNILKDMNKPETYRGLLLEAVNMLTKYEHPNPQDQMRIRGYERISGFIYKELATSIRSYKNKNYSTRAKVDISPYQIWTKIMTDPTVKLVEDTNPIQALKEREVVTFVGEGGRSKESMSKKTRVYQPSDMGVISEATVDSSDVGINAYMSANPQFKNLRGIVKENKEFSPTSLLSTSALLAPGADKDDPKRVKGTRFHVVC